MDAVCLAVSDLGACTSRVALGSPMYFPIDVSRCAPIVCPTFVHCFPPPLYDMLVPSHPVGITFDSHTATCLKHTSASRPIPIPSRKQVGIPRSHQNGRQKIDDGTPIPITMGGRKKIP